MIYENRIILAGMVSFISAQLLKTIIHLIIHKKLEWKWLINDGGMPSSHSAIVTSVAIACGFQCGWDSPLFAVAAVLAVIVMHDARGVLKVSGSRKSEGIETSFGGRDRG